MIKANGINFFISLLYIGKSIDRNLPKPVEFVDIKLKYIKKVKIIFLNATKLFYFYEILKLNLTLNKILEIIKIMFFRIKISIYSFFLAFFLFTGAKGVFAFTIPKGMSCWGSDKGKPDQTICDTSTLYRGFECVGIPSTLYFTDPVWLCTPAGTEYCTLDSDCVALGKNKCIVEKGSYSLFTYNDESPEAVGICGSVGGSVEDNAIGQVICNGINIITGKAGRAAIAVTVIVMGMMFFIGKISWNMLLAVGLGVGAMFGAPAIVSVITGQKFKC
jgi:type IV secretory pathway VirB2 component (pilin)